MSTRTHTRALHFIGSRPRMLERTKMVFLVKKKIFFSFFSLYISAYRKTKSKFCVWFVFFRWCFLLSSLFTFVAGIFVILLFRAIAFVFQSNANQNQHIGQQDKQQANTNGHAGGSQFGQLNATQQAIQNQQTTQQKLKPNFTPPPQGDCLFWINCCFYFKFIFLFNFP